MMRLGAALAMIFAAVAMTTAPLGRAALAQPDPHKKAGPPAAPRAVAPRPAAPHPAIARPAAPHPAIARPAPAIRPHPPAVARQAAPAVRQIPRHPAAVPHRMARPSQPAPHAVPIRRATPSNLAAQRLQQSQQRQSRVPGGGQAVRQIPRQQQATQQQATQQRLQQLRSRQGRLSRHERRELRGLQRMQPATQNVQINQQRMQDLQQRAQNHRLSRSQRLELRQLQRAQRLQPATPQTAARPDPGRPARAARISPQQAASGRFASSYFAPDQGRRRGEQRAARMAAHAAWRLGLAAAYVPWRGPVYWPYAYNDIFYYAFWPDAYDQGYWAYAYDDFFDGIFFPYGAPHVETEYAGPYGTIRETTGTVARAVRRRDASPAASARSAPISPTVRHSLAVRAHRESAAAQRPAEKPSAEGQAGCGRRRRDSSRTPVPTPCR